MIWFYSAVQKISRDWEVTRESFAYIPREDLKMSLLERTDRQTYCPYKGDAPTSASRRRGDRSVNAVWTYEQPFEAVALIAEYIAFYPDRVDEIGESPTV